MNSLLRSRLLLRLRLFVRRSAVQLPAMSISPGKNFFVRMNLFINVCLDTERSADLVYLVLIRSGRVPADGFIAYVFRILPVGVDVAPCKLPPSRVVLEDFASESLAAVLREILLLDEVGVGAIHILRISFFSITCDHQRSPVLFQYLLLNKQDPCLSRGRQGICLMRHRSPSASTCVAGSAGRVQHRDTNLL